MKLTLSKLQQIIREEFHASRANRDIVSESKIDYARFNKIIQIFDNDPTRFVPMKELVAIGIPTNTKHTYHVVYGQLVGQRDEIDVEYWDEDASSWEEIDDVERHHPVSVHRPS
jgi:hypothetical protein